MNNPCDVLRKINDEFSEVAVYPQFDADMNGGQWCTECMVGNQGTPSSHSCDAYQDVLEVIRDAEPQLIVIVENRLLADLPVEFKPLESARKNIKYLHEKITAADKNLLKVKSDIKAAKDDFISNAFDANNARNDMLLFCNGREKARQEHREITEELDTAKGAVTVGGVRLSMTAGNLKSLIRDSVELGLLKAGGVDDWEWYGESLVGSENIDKLVAQEISGLSVEGFQ